MNEPRSTEPLLQRLANRPEVVHGDIMAFINSVRSRDAFDRALALDALEDAVSRLELAGYGDRGWVGEYRAILAELRKP